jgi:hypothetical protein
MSSYHAEASDDVRFWQDRVDDPRVDVARGNSFVVPDTMLHLGSGNTPIDKFGIYSRWPLTANFSPQMAYIQASSGDDAVLTPQTTDVQIRIYNGATIYSSPSSSSVVNVWMHWAILVGRMASTFKVYKNGVLQGTTAMTAAITAT